MMMTTFRLASTGKSTVVAAAARRRLVSTASWASCLDDTGKHASRPTDTTHDVFNQVPRLQDYNAFEVEPMLQEMLVAAGGEWATPSLASLGAHVGSAKWQAEARAADAT